MAGLTVSSHFATVLGKRYLESSSRCIVPFQLNLCAQQHRRHSLVRLCSPSTVSAVCTTDSARDVVTNLNVFSASSAAEEDAVRLEKIREAVRKGVTKAKAAGVLRLVFHEAGAFSLATNKGGMNGSLVLELGRPENQGLNRSVKVLSKVKAALESDVHVSWADLIAVAGAEAVSICGGPKIDVKLGGLDALLPDPEGQMPEETLTGSQLKEAFQDKGFSSLLHSLVHSVGGKGFGDPFTFDHTYYKILLQTPWLGDKSSMIGLDSDRTLPADEECLKWVNTYAQNQDLFFQHFTNAYIKLVNTGIERVA